MRYIAIHITFIFLLIVLGCGNDSVINKAKIQTELDSVDYEIISAAIEQFFYISPEQFNNKKQFYDSLNIKFERRAVIFDSTGFYQFKPHITDVTRLKDSNVKYLTDRLSGENNKRFFIDSAKIITNISLEIISKKDITQKFLDSLYDSDESWLYLISKPSYFENNATLTIHGIGWDTYPKYLFWLRKENGKWTTYQKKDYEHDSD